MKNEFYRTPEQEDTYNDNGLMMDYWNRYRRAYRHSHPEKELVSRLNCAVNLLRKHGVTVTIPETGYTNISAEGGASK